MAKRIIVLQGDPILKKVCRPVTKFNARLWQLLDDMKETLANANGYGLAAPQIGVMRRVFVMLDQLNPGGEEADASESNMLELINPEILETTGEAKDYEGCLSYPGRWGAIKRPERVKVKAYDRHGNPFILAVQGSMARCVCHENDHLNGVTIEELAEYYFGFEDHGPLDSRLKPGRK